MSCAKREYALIVCLGGVFSATVGFALSVFATLLSIFISGPQRPIIETRDAAVKASTPSSQSPSPSRSLSRGKSPLRLHLVEGASSEPESPQTLSRLHSLVKDLPSISVSPAPTHSSFQSESSSETNTLSTVASEFSITPTTATTEQRGRRRLRFSGFTQLFDKRSKTSPRSALCPSSPSDPALASPASPPPPRSPSLYRERPHKALVTRVKSCPGFHHGHGHSSRRSPGHSTFSPPLPLADHPLPLPPMPPTPTPTSPARCRKDKELKEKEPRPRTQPYAAPYFALPPDSPPGPGVLPPIGGAAGARRRPGGRRMATV